MSPGVTILLLPEITLRARVAAMSGESSRILPSFTATSSGACRFCPGSMTVPPLISTSQSGVAACSAPWEGEAPAAPKLLEPSRPEPTINLENCRRVSMERIIRPLHADFKMEMWGERLARSRYQRSCRTRLRESGWTAWPVMLVCFEVPAVFRLAAFGLDQRTDLSARV